MTLHQGTVRADSAGPGQGAMFTVTLPVMDQDAVAATEAGETARLPESARLPDLSGVRVLVVDDDADGRELVRVILSRCGAQVTLAATAKAALDALDGASFDVLVSDISMADNDGYSLIRAIRARDAARGGQIPALALTAHARIEDRAEALAAGYQQYAAKPIEPPKLAAAVATLAGRTGAG